MAVQDSKGLIRGAMGDLIFKSCRWEADNSGKGLECKANWEN